MAITNLTAFDAAIRAVCPAIDGVAADGHIFFQPSATPAQMAAAQSAAAAYVDPAPAQVPDLGLLVQQLVAQGTLTPATHALVMRPAPTTVQAPPIAPTPLAKSILEA